MKKSVDKDFLKKLENKDDTQKIDKDTNADAQGSEDKEAVKDVPKPPIKPPIKASENKLKYIQKHA